MITKPVIKENFIEFLKTNYPECFESGTPITENSLEALIILKKRVYETILYLDFKRCYAS